MIRIFCKICTKSFSFFVFDFHFLGHFCWYFIKIFLPSDRCEHIFIIITVASEKKEKKKNDLKQSKLTEIMLMNLKFYLIIVYIYRNQ